MTLILEFAMANVYQEFNDLILGLGKVELRFSSSSLLIPAEVPQNIVHFIFQLLFLLNYCFRLAHG